MAVKIVAFFTLANCCNSFLLAPAQMNVQFAKRTEKNRKCKWKITIHLICDMEIVAAAKKFDSFFAVNFSIIIHCDDEMRRVLVHCFFLLQIEMFRRNQ